MRRSLIIKLFAIMLAVLAASMTACGSSLYDELADEGYSVKVIFDPSGAWAGNGQNSRDGVTFIELYDPDNVITNSRGETGIPLLAPNDPARGKMTINLTMTDESSNVCYNVGWYTHRELRVDENGEPLDAYGVPTSQSKRKQGYVFSGRWDFENDVVTDEMLNDNGEFTLYAAMVPCFRYEFYEKNESGEFVIISEASRYNKTLTVPFDYNLTSIFEKKGKVCVGAYLDEALTEELTKSYDGSKYYVDFETGTLTQTVIKIYLVWEE